MEEKIKIGFAIHTIQCLTDFGCLVNELRKQNFIVYFFVFSNPSFKPAVNAFRKRKFLSSIKCDKLIWYSDCEDLDKKIKEEKIKEVFAQEVWPFIFEPEKFQNRNYKVFNIVHSVDNFHTRAVETYVLDKSFVGYEKYGEYFGWDKKDYVALGLPKYDIISKLNKEEIIKKYNLPKKFILLLVPNNNLLNWFIIYKIVKEIRKGGYNVVLKGKKPKCHKFIYNFLAKKYFLNDLSFFPFITHELIFASEGVVGFDTTAVEEILMCERPLVNFSIKPYRDKSSKEGSFKQFVPMWGSDYCMDLNFFDRNGLSGLFKKIPNFINHFTKKIDYHKIQEEVFSVPGGASERIVEWLKKEHNL